ncbi:ATP-grasp domain-containing protein [Flocculibacter collagenilyticus]|uniref:ATP-grasp domain-containing protein n=1 Tax=Flocculibacter collagenilyticus TaxID=2744479 RepID=UPI0018F46834|nr:hypothetical protein [Flocculibacter collagenilyticus]
MTKQYDVVVLTEDKYAAECFTPQKKLDWYSLQVLLEDQILIDALTEQGLTVTKRSWSDPSFDWEQAKTLLFRTTWDYFDRFDEFSTWLNSIKDKVQTINNINTIIWNFDKRYLHDLQNKGINVVDTYILEQNQTYSLAEEMDKYQFEEAILKPVISGAARHTYRINQSNVNQVQAHLDTLIQHEHFMLQPFQKNIVTEGELSLMVMGGKVTHAVKKTAKKGDFRVQDDHGGSVAQYTPNQEQIAFAEAAIAACSPQPLYARVDIIEDNNGQLAIMELELIEPELFFRFNHDAAHQLATTVKQYLSTF